MENHHFLAGKIHYKWPFSIAMLVYQMVIPIDYHYQRENPIVDQHESPSVQWPRNRNRFIGGT